MQNHEKADEAQSDERIWTVTLHPFYVVERVIPIPDTRGMDCVERGLLFLKVVRTARAFDNAGINVELQARHRPDLEGVLQRIIPKIQALTPAARLHDFVSAGRKKSEDDELDDWFRGLAFDWCDEGLKQ